MIWFILGIAPFIIGGIWMFRQDWEAMALTVVTTAVILGFILLATYGAWQMGWFEHCGDFWESASC